MASKKLSKTVIKKIKDMACHTRTVSYKCSARQFLQVTPQHDGNYRIDIMGPKTDREIMLYYTGIVDSDDLSLGRLARLVREAHNQYWAKGGRYERA